MVNKPLGRSKVIRWLRKVKIVILTSMGKRGDAVRLEALGCSGYLLKPVKQQMLYEALLAI